MKPCLGLFPLVLASLAAAQEPQQEPQQELDVLSLQHVCGQPVPIAPPPWGTLLSWFDPDQRPDLLGARDATVVDPDLAATLLARLQASAVENGELHIESRGDGLVLLGRPAHLAQVREAMQELGAIVLRPLEVEAALWDAGDGEAPPAVLGPAEWRTWFGEREPLWRSTATTQSARPVALDHQRWTRYVADIETNVAQKQTLSSPVGDAFADGGRIVVAPHALASGDDCVLYVQFGLAGRRGAVRTIPTGVPGQPDLETPLLETMYGACSARIANGGAIAVTLRGDAIGGGSRTLTVRVTGRTPPPATDLQQLTVLPCSALASPALTQRLHPPSPYPGDPTDPMSEGDDLGAGFGRLEIDALLDLVRSGAGAAGEECEFRAGGGFLFVFGPHEVRTRIAAVLDGLQQKMLRTVRVRHRVDVAGETPAALHEIVFPTLLGREATLARLLETRTIHELAGELAQEAAVHEPGVRTLQVGCWLRVRTAPVGAQQHLQLFAQAAHAPLPQLRSVVPTGGNLQPTEVSSVRTLHDAAVGNAETIDFGDGPALVIDGQARRTSIATTLHW